ncbi:MAG: VWA domain-containing protein [Deltaproteobacteria bacterium]|nr:VWA domain-containing protein [Deltaproteobacteria bacterium]
MKRWALALVLLVNCAEDVNPPGDSGRRTDARSGDATLSDGAGGNGDGSPGPRDGGTTLDPDAACASQDFSTTRAPASLMLLVDRSNSMNDPTAAGVSRWVAAQRALTRLVMRLPPETQVGLMFFPTDLVSVPTAGDSASNYTRASVPVGPLSGNRAQLLSKIAMTAATGRTPMACAMPGAIAQMRALMGVTAPTRYVVMITDGLPTFDCTGRGRCDPTDMPCLAEVERLATASVLSSVRAGVSGMPVVRTFSIGTPDASNAFLSSIATAAGTERAPGCTSTTCHYSIADANFERDLDMALDAIRGRTSTCEYALDTIDPSTADPNLVNVRYTSPTGVVRVVPRDRTRSNGWDYSPSMRSILFYGPVCEEIRASEAGAARVQVLYGCPTIIPG